MDRGMKWFACVFMILCVHCGGMGVPEDAGADARVHRDGWGSDADVWFPCIGLGCPTSCDTDLSGVGTGDFRISFTLTTIASGLTIPLVSQRADCGHPFWDVSLRTDGIVVATTDDGTGEAFVESGAPVNDGMPHHIVIARTSGVLSYSDEGMVRASAPDALSLGPLPPLSIGTSACAGATPLAGHGTLADLCITRP